METPKYNTSQYARNASKKYYDTHKEKKKQASYKYGFKVEFGEEFVEHVYKECDSDLDEIRAVMKLKRKLVALQTNVSEKHKALISYNGSKIP